jgi:hypothetical protein
MSTGLPGRWPRGVWRKGLTANANMKRLAEWCLKQAVLRWNARSAAADHGVKYECVGYL